eukprot:scaffold51784_cov54-Attheya_sp.AAC.1
MMREFLVILVAIQVCVSGAFVAPALVPKDAVRRMALGSSSAASSATTTTTPEQPAASSIFDALIPVSCSDEVKMERIKSQILQLGAALDRGQSYNPTSGEYYASTMEVAKSKIEDLIALSGTSKVPTNLESIAGEWELVLTTVKHGIFRSSPFFLAVQEAFGYAEEKGRLHRTLTC